MPKGQGQATVKDVMHKFKHGTLHSGSKTGPQVQNRDQAIAIALSEGGFEPKPKSKSKLAKKAGRRVSDAYAV